MQAIGLCRFSYPAIGGFQVRHETPEARSAYLYDATRLEERFRLFETLALPCLRAQTDQDFTLIIVIGDQFPTDCKNRLNALVADIPQARLHQEPPRKHREVMKEILNDARVHPAEPCLQFRYDDDDAVAVDFIAKLRTVTEECHPFLAQHRTVAFDWNQGYIAHLSRAGISAAQLYRAFNTAALAMYVKGGSRATIMNFAHQKIPQFMPCISLSDPDMWVRSNNQFNDSRQKPVKDIPLRPLTPTQEQLFQDRFAITNADVQRVFSAS